MNISGYDRVVDALRAHGSIERGGNWQCPAHDDTTPSLSVSRGDDRALVHCHAGCEFTDILDALDLPRGGNLDDTADYRYPGGAVVHRAPGKKFSQSGNKADTSLFGADLIAGDDTSLVMVCEGEKDALTVRYHFDGVVGVSARQGAGTDPARYDWTPLKNRAVIVVADDDPAGRRHAAKVAALLTNVASSVRVVTVAEGNDLTDHVQHGWGLDDLIDATEACTVRPERELRVTFGHQVTVKPIAWMIDEWIPWGFLTLLAGREGLGKSTIACKIAAERTQQGDTIVYIASEDSIEHVVAPRLRAAGADMARVMFLNVVTEFSDTGQVEFPADLPALEKLVDDHNVRLVVLDAVTSVVSQREAGDGNNDRRIRSVLEPMAAVAARHNMVMLGLCHFGKKDSSDTGKLMMGSIAWSQVARSVLAVAADEEQLVITNTKSNLARRKRSEKVELVTKTIEDGIEIGVAEWRGETTTSATDLLGDSDEREQRSEVENWLYDYLLENPDSPSAEVKRECIKDTGASASKIDRAARKLAIVKVSRGMPRKTFWSLPTDGDSHVTPPTDDATDVTDATGADLHKRDDVTAVQSRQSDATAAQSRHSVSAGHGQLRQSRQSRHDCHHCGEPMVFPDDIAEGFHASCAWVPGAPTDNTPGMTDRVRQALNNARQQEIA